MKNLFNKQGRGLSTAKAKIASAVIETLEQRQLMTLYAVEILDPQAMQGIANNINKNAFSLAINSGVQATNRSGTAIANLALVNSTSQASAVAADIAVTTTGTGTTSLREAGQTGHQAPSNEDSLAEALGLQANQLIYAYEDSGGSDNDYNDGYARIRVTVADDAMQASISESGVKYGVGDPVTASKSISSSGFGWQMGEGSNWSTDPLFAADSVLGNGWSSGSQLRAIPYGDGIKIDQGNGSALFFNSVSITPSLAEFGSLDTLQGNNGKGTFARLLLKRADGSVISFYGFSTATPAAQRGQLDSITDPYGNVTTAAYNGSNQISTITRSSGSFVEKLTFTYGTTGGATGRVIGVTQSRSTDSGSTYTDVRSTEYVYYNSGDTNGNSGDLRSTIVHHGGLGGGVISQNYYRYYVPSAITNIHSSSYSGGSGSFATITITGGPTDLIAGDQITVAGSGASFDGTFKVLSANSSGTITYRVFGTGTVPSDMSTGVTVVAKGYKGGLKYAVVGAAVDRLTAAYSNPDIATNVQLSPYATSYYEYSSDRQVTKAVTAATGDSSTTGGLGTSVFTYTGPSTVGATEGYNNWSTKTTETLSDGSTNTVYSNVFGQTILSVHSNGSQQWSDFYRYDAAGRTILHANPSAVSGFSESLVDLVGYDAGTGTATYLRDGTSSSDQGLIELFVYGTTDTATESTASDAPGYLKATYVVKGDSGGLNTPPTGAVKTGELTYFKRSGGGATVYPVATATQYRNADGTGAETTSFAYTYYTGTTRIKTQTTTLPVVTTAQNGSNTAVSEATYFDQFGHVIWVVNGAGFITYNKFDTATGAIVKQISDADPTLVSDAPAEVTAPTRASGLATALHLAVAISVDDQGRATKVTDANGNITYSVYSDTGHSVRVYPGWNATTGTTTGPTTVIQENRGAGTTEALTTNVAPAVSGSAGSYVPTGGETVTTGSRQSYVNSTVNAAGQVIYSDEYTGPSAYLRTEIGYDNRGRVNRTKSPDGTWNYVVYDDLNRTAAVWKGTNNTGATQANPASGGGSNNMVQVGSYVYDAGGVGDSNLTQSNALSGLASYATKYAYDFRDRMIATRGADNVAAAYTLDNLGAATVAKTYADADADFVIDSTELRGQTDTSFDEWGRAYESKSYRVSPTTGVADHYLTSDYWYDQRGFLIKSSTASGLLSKTTYDGAGRLTRQALSIDPTETSYADALTLTGDQTIEQTDLWLDAGGRTRIATLFKRNAQESTGVTGPLTSNDAYYMATGYWYDAADRLIASADYGQDGSEASGNATSGTRFVWQSTGAYKDTNSNGTPDVAEAAVPTAWTDTNEYDYTYMLGKYEYDDAGRLKFSYDNKNRKTHTAYDLAGRVTKTVDNYIDGASSATERDQDRVTNYVYDTLGRLQSIQAENANGSSVVTQATYYVYEDATDAGRVTAVAYPDSTDLVVIGKGGKVTLTGTDHTATTFDRLGRVATSTDQRGVVHTYAYDSAGRLASDSIGTGTLPAGVDGLVRTIAYGYDDLSRVQAVTSKDASNAVLNEVKYTYDGWGNAVKSQQEHAGAVTGTSPATEYVYEEGETGNVSQYVRLRNVKYPRHDDSVGTGAGSIQYTYDSSGIGAALSRIYGITTGLSGGAGLVTYRHIGAYQKINQIFHPGVAGGLLLNNGGDADNYNGFDRFGRQRKVQWQTTDGVTNFEQRLYKYDRAGNRVGTDVNAAGFDETYAYDGLDRLIDYRRGDLSVTTGEVPPTGTTQKFRQYWGTLDSNGVVTTPGLDSLGNWTVFAEDANGGTAGGLNTQTRTFNTANEIGDITNSNADVWGDPDYDKSGNLIRGPKGGGNGSETTAVYLKYDGWNRFAGYDANGDGDLFDNGDVRYAYDGNGQRIGKDYAGGTTDDLDYYYNESWQVLEVRRNNDADPLERYIWDETYVDAPVTIERDTNTDGTRDQRLWATYDANHNVTSVLTDGGKLVERYVYTPYGTRTVLNGSSNYAGTGADPDGSDWSLDSTGDSYDVKPGHQGLMWDAETGQWQNRARFLNSSTGVFLSRDKYGYVDSLNLYESRASSPIANLDPSGNIIVHIPGSYMVDGNKLEKGDIERMRKLMPDAQVRWETVDEFSGHRIRTTVKLSDSPDTPAQIEDLDIAQPNVYDLMRIAEERRLNRIKRNLKDLADGIAAVFEQVAAATPGVSIVQSISGQDLRGDEISGGQAIQQAALDPAALPILGAIIGNVVRALKAANAEKSALQAIISEATQDGRKALSVQDAEAALELAQEAGLPIRAHISDVTGKHWVGGKHIHIPGISPSHIPVEPGVTPR